MKLRLDRWRRYRGQLPGGPAGDGETPVASATCLTILSGHPWRPAGSMQSSLTFFYRIHSGTVNLDKDKYLTPAPNLRRTRASHESQYTRYFAHSDALKNSFFPRTIPMWNYTGIVFPLQLSHLRPLRSLRLRFRLLVQRYVF